MLLSVCAVFVLCVCFVCLSLRLELLVFDLPAAVGVDLVDQLLDVDRQAEVLLDDLHTHTRKANTSSDQSPA